MKNLVAFLAVSLFTLNSSSWAVLLYEEAGASANFAGQGLVGFNFTVDSPIEVSSLGFYGLNMGGGDTPWVALYDVTNNTQLAQVTTFTPTPGWQYISLNTPVTLSAGSTYQVAATAYWSPRFTDTASFTFGPEINPIGFTAPAGWGGWGAPTMATASIGTTANVVANLQYTAVPEPAAVALVCAGLGAVLFFRRRILA